MYTHHDKVFNKCLPFDKTIPTLSIKCYKCTHYMSLSLNKLIYLGLYARYITILFLSGDERDVAQR